MNNKVEINLGDKIWTKSGKKWIELTITSIGTKWVGCGDNHDKILKQRLIDDFRNVKTLNTWYLRSYEEVESYMALEEKVNKVKEKLKSLNLLDHTDSTLGHFISFLDNIDRMSKHSVRDKW